MAQPDARQQQQVAQQLQQQLQALDQQREQINQLLNQLRETKEAIEAIGDADPDEKVLLPLGSGAYVHVRVEDPDAVLAPLGNGVLAEEPPEKAIERLDAREEEAREAREQVAGNIEELQDQLEGLMAAAQGGQGEAGPQGAR